MVSVRLIFVSALILPVGCGKLLEDTLKLVSPPATCGPLGPVDIQELDAGDYTLTVLRFDGFPLHYALSLYPRRGFLNELGQFVLSGPEAEVKNGRIPPTRIEELVEQARDIAKKIEETMTYPGEIKVTVLREIRAVEYAK